ncbi:MAG TPA: transporter substrate-binding domain-containing protein [Vicinamibacteria bacterium]|nr:transporter substrate-binding domain-containing protein [Vicinamibacteria bacterium]
MRFLVLASMGLAGAAGAYGADLPELKARGVLKVIAQRDEAPEMFAFTAGAAPGFEREMVEGFARLHGLKVEAVAVKTSDDRIPTLSRGDGDVIIGIVETEARRKLVDFTSEVIPARHLVVCRKPKSIKTVEEFQAEKVGVVKGTSWAAAALDAGVPAARTEFFPDRDVLLAALKDGKITATVMTVSDFTLAAKRDADLVGGVFVGPAASAGWAVRKEDRQLRAALNEYLDNFRKGPSWSRLVVKYFGEQALSVLGRK